MREYDNDEIRESSWLKEQSYIHSSNALGMGDSAGWTLIEKFPIDKIIHNAATYPNKISMDEVNYMINNFHPFGFYPIRLNKNYVLVDGQHRLKVAVLCNFDFIDVWIE